MTTPSLTNRGEAAAALNQTAPAAVGARRTHDRSQTCLRHRPGQGEADGRHGLAQPALGLGEPAAGRPRPAVPAPSRPASSTLASVGWATTQRTLVRQPSSLMDRP